MSFSLDVRSWGFMKNAQITTLLPVLKIVSLKRIIAATILLVSLSNTTHAVIFSFTSFAGSGIVQLQGSADGIGATASFKEPHGVAVDSSGNVYVADSGNNKIRKVTPAGIVTTYAGSGMIGSSDGAGSAAAFNGPRGVAVDSMGNVYVADTENNKIRKISPTGVVSTLAGSENEGKTDGLGAVASFRAPRGLAVDTGGNVYVADTYNSLIRKISPAGLVTTIAGSGNFGIGTGPELGSIWYPHAVAVDSAGNVYIADTYNYKILKLTSTGILSTLAGSGVFGNANGIGEAAGIYSPVGVAVDPSGAEIYVVDGFSTIRKISSAGMVTSIAGTSGLGADDGVGSAASFMNPVGIAVDSGGHLYIGDWGNHSIRKITATGSVTSLAGIKVDADGTGALASFNNPSGVAVDSGGNVHVADQNNHKIRKVSASAVVTTEAGKSSYGNADGGVATATFDQPRGIAVDALGNRYVADASNHKIRRITPLGVVDTLAGSGLFGDADGSANSARFAYPSGVSVDNNGNVYVADTFNHKIRKINQAGIVTTIAGSGARGDADGIGVNARFSSPRGVAVDRNGNVLVADSSNHKIRHISASGVVMTLAGTGMSGSIDGPSALASFNEPTGVALDDEGNIFIADRGNHKIRMLSPQGVVTTIGGSVRSGMSDGFATNAKFNFPYGITVDSSGNLYVADESNHKIRKGTRFLSQTISFVPVGTKAFGDAPFILTANANSALPISFEIISGPVTISGKTVKIKGAGIVVIRAVQGGDSKYGPATSIDQTFLITGSYDLYRNWADNVGLVGPDRDASSVPFRDGVPNLLKYAFHMNATKPDVSVLQVGGVSGLPHLIVDFSDIRYTVGLRYLRNKYSGLIYTPQRSTSLNGFAAMTGVEEVEPINDQWEIVTMEQTIWENSCFLRVQVSFPEN